jgi:hypothetical protein
MAATFAETPLIRSKHRQEAIVRVVLGLMAVAMSCRCSPSSATSWSRPGRCSRSIS